MTAPVRGGSGYGVTALTLGILGLFLAVVPYVTVVGALLGGLALVFGLVGRSRTKRDLATGEGMAVAGVSLSVVALATSLTVYNRPPHQNQQAGQSQPTSSLSLPTPSTPPPSTPSSPPSGPKKTLLKASGDTVGSTDEFTTTQDWDINWSFDCGGSSLFPRTSFSVYTLGDYRDQLLMTGRITKKDSGVQHMHALGTFSLTVSSLCPWQVTITG